METSTADLKSCKIQSNENISRNQFLKSDGQYEQRQGQALLSTYNSLLDVRYVIE
jgi:hypothetical protein